MGPATLWALLFWVTVVAAGRSRGENQDEQSNPDHLLSTAITINSLCRRGVKFVGLGACARSFIECSADGQTTAFRTCPGELMVFSNGKCRATEEVVECFDAQMNTMNEETRQLVEKDEFCTHGAAVYFGKSQLSRQALVCHDNLRDITIAGCPFGSRLTQELKCEGIEKGYDDTSGEAFHPIRQYFVHRHCDRKSLNPYVHYDNQPENDEEPEEVHRAGKCATWYIDCTDKPTLIRCQAGHLFDHRQGVCRRWTHSDLCPARGVCVGNEWQVLPVQERCSSQFIRCEGQKAHFFQCPRGLHFNGQECGEVRECGICKLGEKRRSERGCDHYMQCVNSNGSPSWAKMQCNSGRTFNEDLQTCQDDYTCAAERECNNGDSYSLNCHTFAKCNSGTYEWYSCPKMTSWNRSTQTCVRNSQCRRGDQEEMCRENDIIQTTDCRTFQMCMKGQFESFDCQKKGHFLAPCQKCREPMLAKAVPGQCQDGDLKAHFDECGTYYRCSDGVWNAEKCEQGRFDVQAGQCVTDGRMQCGNGHELACKHGSFLVPQPNCGRFLQCKFGQWQEFECPDSYTFSKTAAKCVPGSCENGQYGDVQYEAGADSNGQFGIPTNTSLRSREPSDVYRQPISGSYGVPSFPQPPAPPPSYETAQCRDKDRVVDPIDCTRFLECTQYGRYRMMECPPRTFFDPFSRSCIQGENCGQPAKCQKGWYQPVEQCGRYRICWEGEWREGRCPNNQPFINGRCDTGKACPGYTDPYTQQDCQSGQVRAHPNNNRAYWVCDMGGWVQRECPEKSYFDWKTSRCVWDQQLVYPEPPGDWCYQGQKRAIAGQCGLFELCYQGKWYKQSCEFGSGFADGRCIRGLCEGMTVGGECTQREGVENYRLDPMSCDHYYQCAPYGWQLMPCGAGTVWNPEKTVCDWPREVPYCNAKGTYDTRY